MNRKYNDIKIGHATEFLLTTFNSKVISCCMSAIQSRKTIHCNFRFSDFLPVVDWGRRAFKRLCSSFCWTFVYADYIRVIHTVSYCW